MDAQRRLLRIVPVAVGEAEARGHGEVHLVDRDGEFAPDVVAVRKHLHTCTSIFGP